VDLPIVDLPIMESNPFVLGNVLDEAPLSAVTDAAKVLVEEEATEAAEASDSGGAGENGAFFKYSSAARQKQQEKESEEEDAWELEQKMQEQQQKQEQQDQQEEEAMYKLAELLARGSITQQVYTRAISDLSTAQNYLEELKLPAQKLELVNGWNYDGAGNGAAADGGGGGLAADAGGSDGGGSAGAAQTTVEEKRVEAEKQAAKEEAQEAEEADLYKLAELFMDGKLDQEEYDAAVAKLTAQEEGSGNDEKTNSPDLVGSMVGGDSSNSDGSCAYHSSESNSPGEEKKQSVESEWL
jgi:hypothetical protein